MVYSSLCLIHFLENSNDFIIRSFGVQFSCHSFHFFWLLLWFNHRFWFLSMIISQREINQFSFSNFVNSFKLNFVLKLNQQLHLKFNDLILLSFHWITGHPELRNCLYVAQKTIWGIYLVRRIVKNEIHSPPSAIFLHFLDCVASIVDSHHLQCNGVAWMKSNFLTQPYQRIHPYSRRFYRRLH